MTRRSRAIRLALIGLALAAAPEVAAQSGWERVTGGPGTTCALGSPFSFWVHRGSPERLALYLRGGGACWNETNCDPNGRPTYVSTVDEQDAPAGGLMELDNLANPLRDFTVVYVPYCTGDVHLGSRDVTYEGGLVIRHRGRDNVETALDWAFRSIAAPGVVLVAGESAGALPSPVYALALARRYPNARIVQIGDGAGAFRAAASLTQWGAVDGLKHDAAFAALDAAAPSYLALYELVARAAPRVQLAQINSAEDSVQRRFLELRGNPDTRVAAWLGRNMAQLRSLIPGFRAYSMPGIEHTVLRRPEFYPASVDGVSLRDWVARLLAGQEVRDVGDALLTR
jgi:hypothetical protein